MKAQLVINDQAGSLSSRQEDAPTPAALRDAFAAAGVDATVRRVVGAAIATTVREALQLRPDAVIAGGGDGTVSAVASRLVDTGVPLGVLPLGTLNHFATDLGLPSDWRSAIRVVAAGARRAVDVAEVNGHVFLNNCSLGAYAEAVRRRDALRRTHGHGKKLAMLLAWFSVVRELRRHRLQLATPGSTLALRTPLVLVANNRYTSDTLATLVRPRLDEGRLWIYVTKSRNRGAFLRLVWQALFRDLEAADALEALPAAEATITAARPLPIAADGETLTLLPPFHFRIRPRALQVLAPPAPG